MDKVWAGEGRAGWCSEQLHLAIGVPVHHGAVRWPLRVPFNSNFSVIL